MKIVLLSSGLASEYGGAAISEASLSAALSHYADVTVLVRKNRLNPDFIRPYKLKEVRAFEPWEPWEALQKENHWLHTVLEGADVFHLNGLWRWENFFFAQLCQRTEYPLRFAPPRNVSRGSQKAPTEEGLQSAPWQSDGSPCRQSDLAQ